MRSSERVRVFSGSAINRESGATDIPVLIQGESGTGKELVAQALHMLSPRRDERLITVNAATDVGTIGGKRAFRLRSGFVHRRRPEGARGEIRAGA